MGITVQDFVTRWQNTALNERQSYTSHFVDLCALVGFTRPDGTGEDGEGNAFLFEQSLKKETGGQGYADVYYQNHFAIEYKAAGKYKDLSDAYQQLLQYREKLNNPPLLVVTDINSWEIHTNYPNTEKRVYRFNHEDIATRGTVLDYLRWLFHDPMRLHPKRNTAQVTADAAKGFKLIADNMRGWQADPERIAHFLTKLVFCLFAEDIGLLPTGAQGDTGIFSEIVAKTRHDSNRFMRYTDELFRAMADGGEMMYQPIQYFNGALFDDVRVEELSLEALTRLEVAARLNWESVEPAIFGTLFERSLDPAKRSQLGAHYTGREDILLIVEPVLMQPLQREWQRIRIAAAPIREKYVKALAGSNRRSINTQQKKLEALREDMLTQIREIRVLDPACGSGNFLYVALQELMNLEKEVIFHEVFAGLTQPIPEVHPRQMYGIEVNPIAHALASIVVWIGFIQWRQQNGYMGMFGEPILEDLRGNIVCMDAILSPRSAATVSPLSPAMSQDLNASPLSPAMSQDLNASPLSPPTAWGEVSESRIGDDESSAQKAAESPPPAKRGELEGGAVHTRTTAEIWEKLKQYAREMRKNPTPAEDRLWQRLRRKQLHETKFRRQHPIDRFIVDFYAHDARLIIEVDGSIHEEPDRKDYDELRQAYLESLGFRVLRFSNGDVLQHTDAVLEHIGETLLSPSPRSGEGFGEGIKSPIAHSTEGFGEGIKSPIAHSTEGLGEGILEPTWPEVDVIIGNPPFLGGSLIRGELGDDYYEQLTTLYKDRVPGFADLVCYWFEKARAHIAAGGAKRAGLLSTNSIRGGANREVLKRIKESGDIFMAHADRPWILDGAAVRVSMTGFDDGSEDEKMLDSLPVADINPDLTGGVNITVAEQLISNLGVCFIGTKKAGSFDIDEALAQEMLESVNSSGRDNDDVLSPWINGTAIVKYAKQKWLINFQEMSQEEAKLYEKPFQHIEDNVYEYRQKNNEKRAREKWWMHRRPAMDMINAKSKISRFIATPRISKYRLFRWYPSNVTPDDGVYIFARDDDYFFGVLHSKLHEVWSLRMGTWLGKGNDPRYTPTTTFETFPFPWSPGTEDTDNEKYQAIAAAAQKLHEERHAWLNPGSPHAKRGELEGGKNFPIRSGGTEGGKSLPLRSGGTEGGLKHRTLTNLYNALAVFRGEDTIKTKPAAGDFAPRLHELHTALDNAVCAAYGWSPDILNDEESILRNLLALNLQRAAEQE